MSLPEKCKNILPEDYFFLNECEAECFCNSTSYEEYVDCIRECYRGYLEMEPLID